MNEDESGIAYIESVNYLWEKSMWHWHKNPYESLKKCIEYIKCSDNNWEQIVIRKEQKKK